MPRCNKISLLVWSTIISMCLLVVLVTGIERKISGADQESHQVVISNFLICDSAEKIHCEMEFSEIHEKLYACGRLETDGFADLNVYLFKDGEKGAVFYDASHDRFYTGEFCQEIILPKENRRGHYQVAIYVFRNKFATGEFYIQ